MNGTPRETTPRRTTGQRLEKGAHRREISTGEEGTMERMEKQTLPWWVMPAGWAALAWAIVALVIDCHADAWLRLGR